MIDQESAITTAAPPTATSSWSTVFAVALMSFSALLLELGLTRIFSVVLFYHFAFLAISIALLGLGAGAVFACVRREWLTQWTVRQLGVALCAGNSILIVCVLEVALHTAVSLVLSWHNFARLTVLYLVAAIPFVVTGLLFSIVFARHPSRITQLYGADLLGGSLACLALVPMLNIIGGPNTIVFAAVASGSGSGGLGCAEEATRARRRARRSSAVDRRELSQQPDRHRLRQGHEAQSAAVCALECHLARRGRPMGHRPGHRDRC